MRLLSLSIRNHASWPQGGFLKMNAAVDAPQAELFIPVARIYGEAMQHLPQDLYIPPDALEIMLDAFEGPLDLLLYLIRKANVDILDIPMAPLTRQYLDYIDSMHASNLELAAEYLVMAAMLIEIKSRMLLPRTKVGEGDEADDPRAELVRRLMEYEQMKLAGLRLNEMPQAEREFYWVETLVEKSLYVRHPDVSVADLKEAWDAIFRQAKLTKNHKITAKSCRFANIWASSCVFCRSAAALSSLKPCLIRPWARPAWSCIFWPCWSWLARNWSNLPKPRRFSRFT
jgi:segregation and condensation protein A